MKTKLLICLFSVAFAQFGATQVHPHAIGIRGGVGIYSFGGEISYQHGIGSGNRLELDLGWRGRNRINENYTDIGITGIYQWVRTIDGGLNWFVGIGGQVGFYDNRSNKVSGISLGVGGQIGLEYDFNTMDIPLALTFDVRPMISLGNYYFSNRFGYGAAFGLRYTF